MGYADKMTCTPLFSSLPSGVFIRSDSAKQVAGQCEGRLMLFKALLSWLGDQSLRKVVDLVRPRPFWSKGASGTKAPMKRRRAWRGQWSRKEQFCFILVAIANSSVFQAILSSIKPQHKAG